MESFEFLGGRYNRPEQIMSGPVQAFKAQNAATGRTVFIHRVSTKEAPQEQSALLMLLTTALVKSADAKRLVLDFGEELGYWYVVTESEPQCALLREWLQTEITNAAGGAKPAAKVGMPPKLPPETAGPSDPGEFTRFLQRPSMNTATTPRPGADRPPTQPTVPAVPPVAPMGEFSRIFERQANNQSQANNQKPQLPVEPAASAAKPGEFTGFFSAHDVNVHEAEPKDKPVSLPPAFQPSQPAQDAESKSAPGEFTRFFTPGLPAVPPKPTNPQRPIGPLNPTGLPNNPYVQRPHTPVAPILPKQTEPGEFTRMFSSKPSGNPVSGQPEVRNDPMGFAKPQANQLNDLSDNLFNSKIDVGQALPSSQSQHGEFTKLFGAVGAESPAIQPQAVVSAPPQKPLLDESQHTVQFPALKSQAPTEQPLPGSAGAHTPSDFTMIMQGGYGQTKPAAGPPQASSSGGSPIDFQVAPLAGAATPYLSGASGSMAGVQGNVSQHGASVNSALGSAHIGAPKLPPVAVPDQAAANKKLMLFFVLLGVLALVLVVVIMILMKSK